MFSIAFEIQRSVCGLILCLFPTAQTLLTAITTTFLISKSLRSGQGGITPRSRTPGQSMCTNTALKLQLKSLALDKNSGAGRK